MLIYCNTLSSEAGKMQAECICKGHLPTWPSPVLFESFGCILVEPRNTRLDDCTPGVFSADNLQSNLWRFKTISTEWSEHDLATRERPSSDAPYSLVSTRRFG
jgi:hypothetical protein